MNTYLKTILAFASITAMAVATSSAAITVTDSFHVRTENGGGTDGDPNTIDRVGGSNFSGTIASGWSLNGGNTVAIYFASENTAVSGFSATFGGEAMTIVQTIGGTNNHMSAVGYLINPTGSTGDVDIVATHNGTGRNSFVVGLLSLSGVDSVADSDTGTGFSGFDLSYTVGANGGFVMGNAVNNSFDFSSPPTITSSNLDTNLFASNFDGNTSAVLKYGNVAAGGIYTDSYGSTEAGSTLAFNAIPEPSSFALILLGLGGLCLLRRRG